MRFNLLLQKRDLLLGHADGVRAGYKAERQFVLHRERDQSVHELDRVNALLAILRPIEAIWAVRRFWWSSTEGST